LTLPGVSVVPADVEDPDAPPEEAFDEAYYLAAVVGVRHGLADFGRVLRVNARPLLNALDFDEKLLKAEEPPAFGTRRAGSQVAE
jgi:hypothetical protein